MDPADENICQFCQKLKDDKTWSVSGEHYFIYKEHQPSLHSLSQSANMGCQLCCVLKAGYIKWVELGYPKAPDHGTHIRETTLISHDRDGAGNILQFFIVLHIPNRHMETQEMKGFSEGFQYRRGYTRHESATDLLLQAGPTFQVADPMRKFFISYMLDSASSKSWHRHLSDILCWFSSTCAAKPP